MNPFPNRSHYAMPALAGLGVILVGSFLPILNVLNVVLIWYVVGGLLAGYLLRKRAPSASTKELAVVGAISAVFASFLLGLFYSVFGCLFWGLLIEEARGDGKETIGFLGVLTFAALWIGGLTLQPLAGALGGRLSSSLWPASAGRDSPPPTPEELETQKAKRTKVLRIFGALGAGGLLVTVLSCVGMGYLLHLEEQHETDAAGTAAVVDMPITANTPVTFELPDVRGRYVLWLVGEGIDASGIQGRMHCSAHSAHVAPILAEEFLGRSFHSYSYMDHVDYPSWHYLSVETTHEGDEQCSMRVTAPDPLPRGTRLVVTHQARPSDWLD